MEERRESLSRKHKKPKKVIEGVGLYYTYEMKDKAGNTYTVKGEVPFNVAGTREPVFITIENK